MAIQTISGPIKDPGSPGFPLPQGWPTQDTSGHEHGHGQDILWTGHCCPQSPQLLPGNHEERPGQELQALQWEQPPARPTPGTFTQPVPPERMKGPSTASGAGRKSTPGDPECLIPPLPSDCLQNLDLWCWPFHPPAPTPDSSPERRK